MNIQTLLCDHFFSSALELGRILRSLVLQRPSPRGFLMGTVAHSTPDVASPPWSQQPRFASQTDTMQMGQIGNVLGVFVLFLSLWECHYHGVPTRQAYYTEGSTGTANWLLIHVLNTMFCAVGRDHITAITFSSGSQYANRFWVYFSSSFCFLKID